MGSVENIFKKCLPVTDQLGCGCFENGLESLPQKASKQGVLDFRGPQGDTLWGRPDMLCSLICPAFPFCEKKKLTSYIEHWKIIVGLPFVLEKSRPNWSLLGLLRVVFFGSKSTHQHCSWIKRSTATMANRCCWVSSMDHPWVNKSFRFQKYVMLFQLLLLCTSNYIWSFKKNTMEVVHPGSLTWNLRMYPWKRKIILQTMLIFRGVTKKSKKNTHTSTWNPKQPM